MTISIALLTAVVAYEIVTRIIDYKDAKRVEQEIKELTVQCAEKNIKKLYDLYEDEAEVNRIVLERFNDTKRAIEHVENRIEKTEKYFTLRNDLRALVRIRTSWENGMKSDNEAMTLIAEKLKELQERERLG